MICDMQVKFNPLIIHKVFFLISTTSQLLCKAFKVTAETSSNIAIAIENDLAKFTTKGPPTS